MKLKVFLVMFLMFTAVILFASESVETGTLSDKDNISSQKKEDSSTIENRTICQFVFSPGIPKATYNSEVNGLKFGLLLSGGKGCVNGVEMAVLSCSTSKVYGVQMSPFVNIANIMEGLQMCTVSNTTDNMTGCQVSLINSSKETGGVQFGAININTEIMTGWQAGVYNYADKVDGLQLGVLNMANKSGIQLGLVNIITDGWIPVLPLINFSFQTFIQ